MAANQDSTGLSLRAVDIRLQLAAKKWWAITLACRLGVFVLSMITVLVPNKALGTAIAAGVVLLASEVCLWQSNKYNDAGQTLHRKLEMRDSFGWEISALDRKEFVSKIPKKIRVALPSEAESEQYFASQEPPGARKALENVQESAWWSLHLTGIMLNVCVGSIIALVALGFVSLVLALGVVADEGTRSTLGQVIISGVTLIFSLELIRLTIGHYQFNQAAKTTVADAQTLLGTKTGTAREKEREAMKLWNEYQLARVEAPLIPQWVYNWKQDDFNTAWNEEYPEIPATANS